MELEAVNPYSSFGLCGGSWGAMAGEAPVLKELVAAGSLPPLEDRLPANLLVVAPLNEVGTYGGKSREAQAACRFWLVFPPEPSFLL